MWRSAWGKSNPWISYDEIEGEDGKYDQNHKSQYLYQKNKRLRGICPAKLTHCYLPNYIIVRILI